MWTLILFVYAGAFSDSDSVALTNVEGFKSEGACEYYGSKAASLVSGTKKSYKFICVQVAK